MNLEIIETPTSRKLLPRSNPPRAIIVHATGEVDLDKCLAWYTDPKGLGPHYMVTATGSIRRFARENHVAYHAAMAPEEAKLYRRGWDAWSRYRWLKDAPVELDEEFDGYAAWRDQWRAAGLESPIDLPTAERPNLYSVGIEVQSLAEPTAAVFNEEQYTALAWLVGRLCYTYHWPVDRTHVLGHYDVSPLRRSTRSGSFDPGARFDWERLLVLAAV